MSASEAFPAAQLQLGLPRRETVQVQGRAPYPHVRRLGEVVGSEQERENQAPGRRWPRDVGHSLRTAQVQTPLSLGEDGAQPRPQARV